MINKNREKKHRITNGRSVRSREALADSFMSTSNKIWTAIILSLISIPILTIGKAIFSGAIIPIDSMFNSLSSQMGFMLAVVEILGVAAAHFIRNIALDIYDTLD